MGTFLFVPGLPLDLPVYCKDAFRADVKKPAAGLRLRLVLYSFVLLELRNRFY